MRHSIDAIKAELGKGKLVTRTRQQGKTTALLEFVHEYCCGLCYIVACNANMADLIKRQYRDLYPHDKQPKVLSFGNLRGGQALGGPHCWVSDEVWPDAIVATAHDFRYLAFLGGVGSSESMDNHSGRW